jgi:signal peptidase II
MKNIRYFLLTIFILVLDQFSKYLIRLNFIEGETLRLTPKFFWLTYVENTGAAFSFSIGSPGLNRLLFSIITFLAAIFVTWLLLKAKHPLEKLGFSLVLAGALGNLIDRVSKGSVTDFVDWDFPNFIMERWPIFNVADSSLVLAIVLLSIYFLFIDGRSKAPAETGTT